MYNSLYIVAVNYQDIAVIDKFGDNVYTGAKLSSYPDIAVIDKFGDHVYSGAKRSSYLDIAVNLS